MSYEFEKLKQAIIFNSVEVLPTDEKQLDLEIQTLVNEANQSRQKIRHYIGFEISGKIHIGTGMMAALTIKELTLAGVQCQIFLADYHTFLNNKLDGKFETIHKVAVDYFAPVMLKCCEVVGCDMSKVKIILANELYESTTNKLTYWTFLLKTSKELTLNRVLKSVSIMGKSAGEGVDFGTLMYPAMQVNDAFFMQTQIVHAGLDQRKCHVLMREASFKLDDSINLKIGEKIISPLVIHHKLLLGLEKPKIENNGENTEIREVAKMSKSKPDSAIWVHDSLEEITRKLKKAYCPMPQDGQTLDEIEVEQNWNPLLDWCENFIYPSGKSIDLERKEEFGGNQSYSSYEDLKKDYFSGKVHPLDLKNAVAKTLADWFSPIREFVETNPSGLNFLEEVLARRK